MKRQHVKGASLDDWRGDVWQLGSGDDGARLDAGPKDVLIFELDERASTGFRWEAREAVDLGFGLIDDTSTFDEAVVGGTGERPESGGETQTIMELYARSEQATGRPQRAIERFTQAVGRPRTVFALLAFVAGWVAFHTLKRSFDPPPFFWLQGLLGLFALLVATMVLITQNRQGKHQQQRDLVELHMNLLVEQKVAKLIALVEELRRDLPGVTDRRDPEAQDMARSVDPHAVAESLERGLEALKKDPEGSDGE